MTRLRRMKEAGKSAKITGTCTGTHKRSANLQKKIEIHGTFADGNTIYNEGVLLRYCEEETALTMTAE